jgi:hypothetical protein
MFFHEAIGMAALLEVQDLKKYFKTGGGMLNAVDEAKMGHGFGIISVALAAMFLILNLQTVVVGFTAPPWIILGIIFLPTMIFCFVAVSDDKYWALGLFYHNPDDPACFVGNRFGGNIGFNYSRLPVKIGVFFRKIKFNAALIFLCRDCGEIG